LFLLEIVTAMGTRFCLDNEQLAAYLKGALSEPEAVAVEEHLSHCETCETAVRTLDPLSDILLSAFCEAEVESEPFASDPQFRRAVEAICKLAEEEPGPAEESPQDDDRPQPVTPRTLGEYEIQDRLASGGMGTVYKAFHTRLNRVVAIKMLAESRHADAAANFRFDREIRAAGSLDHPNIVRALDAREIDGSRFLVMEFVEGMDLARLVHQYGRLPIADACELIRQAALGLQSAHEAGLVHRDIKPSNLMLTPQGQVKVLDLGLALFHAQQPTEAEMTAAGQAVGTAEYIAPEQVSDSHQVDIRADIYGLGCTLYKLLTARAPFDAPQYRTQIAKMAAHLRDPIPPIRLERRDVPETLAAVLDKMLAKSPTERYGTPDEVATALAPFCDPCDLPAVVDRARSSDVDRAAGVNTAELCSSAMEPTGATKHGQQVGIAAAADEATMHAKPGAVRGWRRPIVLASVLAAAAALALLTVILIRTKSGTVAIDVDAANAEVSIDEGKITFVVPKVKEPVEIQLTPGEHAFEVRKGGFSTKTGSFTLEAGKRKVLAVKLQELPPQPGAGSTLRDASPPKIIFGRWMPLFTSPDQLSGWDPLNEHVHYSNWIMETKYRGINFPVIAKDASIRARAKKVAGENIVLVLRASNKGDYAAYFGGGRRFGIGKGLVDDHKHFTWVDLAAGFAPQSCDEFFDFEFSAMGEALTLSVNGKILVQTRDSSHTAGSVGVGGKAIGLFTDVALLIPNKASLLADNRRPPDEHTAGGQPLPAVGDADSQPQVRLPAVGSLAGPNGKWDYLTWRGSR
jgi:serine/threonine protein kinase